VCLRCVAEVEGCAWHRGSGGRREAAVVNECLDPIGALHQTVGRARGIEGAQRVVHVAAKPLGDPGAHEASVPRGIDKECGEADFGPSLGERIIRWKASRIVDGRALHGARQRSDLGFVDVSTIATARLISASNRQRRQRLGRPYGGVRKTTPHHVERLPSQPASARETRRRLESSPEAGNRRRWAAREKARCPIAREAQTSSRSTRGTGART